MSAAAALGALVGLLQGAGVGVYQTGTANVAGGLPAIVLKSVPSTPDRVIVLNLVSNGDDRAGGTTSIMVQVRCRGAANDPLDVDTIADSVFPVLNGVRHLAFSGGEITQLTRRQSVQNGSDTNDRYERIDQFYGDLGQAVTTDS